LVETTSSENPWPDERVVVVTDDPTAVEAAVLQLEDWGASPAVMFERGRALRALHVQEPDLVVLDFGRSPEATRSLLVTLEEVQPILPGALHAAPLVVLAEGATAQRIEREAWAPLHVTPHDDPDRMRDALTAAHQDTTPFASPASPVLTAAVAGAAAPAAVVSAATRQASSFVPVAAALLIAGTGVWFAFRRRSNDYSPLHAICRGVRRHTGHCPHAGHCPHTGRRRRASRHSGCHVASHPAFGDASNGCPSSIRRLHHRAGGCGTNGCLTSGPRGGDSRGGKRRLPSRDPHSLQLHHRVE